METPNQGQESAEEDKSLPQGTLEGLIGLIGRLRRQQGQYLTKRKKLRGSPLAKEPIFTINGSTLELTINEDLDSEQVGQVLEKIKDILQEDIALKEVRRGSTILVFEIEDPNAALKLLETKSLDEFSKLLGLPPSKIKLVQYLNLEINNALPGVDASDFKNQLRLPVSLDRIKQDLITTFPKGAKSTLEKLKGMLNTNSDSWMEAQSMVMRHSKIEEEKRKGLILKEEYWSQYNQICRSLVSLIQQLTLGDIDLNNIGTSE